MNNCLDCHWLARKDTGYSNYTVEETFVFCLLDVNPYLPAETSELHSERYTKHMMYGDRCNLFKQLPEGMEQIHLDVEREVTLKYYENDKELYLMIKMLGEERIMQYDE